MSHKQFIFLVLAGTLLLLLGAQLVRAQVDVIDQIVATVDGSPVTESDVQRRISWQQFLARKSGQTNFSAESARRQSIETAIDFQLLQNQAVAVGLLLNADEVNDRIQSVIESNGVSDEQFIADLAIDGISPIDFQQTVVESLLNDKLIERLVIPRLRIREVEIDRYIEANQQDFLPTEEYDLSVIVVSESLSMNFEQKQLLRQVVQDIEHNIERGEDFNQIAIAASRIEGIEAGNLGWVLKDNLDPILASELSASRINQVVGPVVSSASTTVFAFIKDYRQGDGPGFPPLQEYHLARIILQANNEAGRDANAELLESLRNSILNGGSFSEIAKVYSHDSNSRKNGGDLGWIPEDTLPFEYFELLSEMDVGDLSPVQKIDNIVFFLQYLGIREASLEQRKRSFARSRLRNMKLQNEHASWMDELRENATIEYRTIF